MPRIPTRRIRTVSCSRRATPRPILYAALAEAGVFPESRLMTLRQFSSELEGHPTPLIPGVDAATGSLGQGLSVGAGLAIGARLDKSPTRVYVLLGDGEMAEGQIWEAAEFAGHYKLDNLDGDRGRERARPERAHDVPARYGGLPPEVRVRRIRH